MDECATSQHNCEGETHCVNSEGSFTCECNSRFIANSAGGCDRKFMVNIKFNPFLLNGLVRFNAFCILAAHAPKGVFCGYHKVFARGKNNTLHWLKVT